MHIDFQTLFIVRLSLRQELSMSWYCNINTKWSNNCLEQDVVLCGDMDVIKSLLRQEMSFYECSFY